MWVFHALLQYLKLTSVRRRHAKQNKEIISYVASMSHLTNSENVRHKTALRTLQMEIELVRNELMEVKAVNRKLSSQMRTMRNDSNRIRDQVRYTCIVCLEKDYA